MVHFNAVTHENNVGEFVSLLARVLKSQRCLEGENLPRKTSLTPPTLLIMKMLTNGRFTRSKGEQFLKKTHIHLLFSDKMCYKVIKISYICYLYFKQVL